MLVRKIFRWRLAKRSLVLGKKTLVMGVLNITPDSFSDGGKFLSPQKAIQHALALEKAGADIVDIGAESTRPGSAETSSVEELRRLLPVLEALRGTIKIPISIDTRKSSVAEIALGAGAEIINDVSALRYDPRIADVVADTKCGLVLMHMRGDPATMQKIPFAKNVVADVTKDLRAGLAIARKAGVAKSQIVLDPGVGFGKSFPQNYELLRKLPEIAKLGYPLLVGTSRKGFLGHTLALAKEGIFDEPIANRSTRGTAAKLATLRSKNPVPSEERLFATAATVAASILAGAHIVRVHDVAEMAQVAATTDRVLDS
ncbi:MAG: dihydropteroate synthase [Acidobacteria bacterium]|nr:dihydropteroate synthase [Acidobacteriota bacterium]